jgi:DNA primase
VIKAELNSSGMVEKPDIVGAIFGQTEGLLGDELDLRELQEKGRVGRIDVEVENEDGSSNATIEIPSSLDSAETALLAASLETIERVGPTGADIRITDITDQRTSKRDYIVKRAKQLLEDIEQEKPEKTKITDEVKQEVRTSEMTEYRGFKAGPAAEEAEELILVEGRSDLLNLLKNGVKNTLALGGTSVPSNIEDIADEKVLTAFLDGDRGGDLILKELEQKAEPEYVARAPKDKEVEELGKEDLYRALRDKESFRYTETVENSQKLDEEVVDEIGAVLNKLVGTRAVHVLDEDLEVVDRFPIDSYRENIKEIDGCYAVVIDGKMDGEKIDAAEKAGAEILAGMEKTGAANSSKLETFSRQKLPMEVD